MHHMDPTLASIRDLEQRLASGEIPPHKRGGYLDSLYAKLVHVTPNAIASFESVEAAAALLEQYHF